MTVLTFPSVDVADGSSFGLVSNTQVFISELAGTVQTLELPGARWFVRAGWPVLTDADQRAVRAFMVKLRGQGGRFYWGDPAYLRNGPAGALGGTPLVAGGSQTGATLDIDGASLSITNWGRAGDYFHFTNTAGEREMKMLTADVDTDGAGAATLTFEPVIRVSPADNAALTFTGATCQMMLSDPRVMWSYENPAFYGLQIEAVEAFTAQA